MATLQRSVSRMASRNEVPGVLSSKSFTTCTIIDHSHAILMFEPISTQVLNKILNFGEDEVRTSSLRLHPSFERAIMDRTTTVSTQKSSKNANIA